MNNLYKREQRMILEQLTDEELFALSLEKNSKNIATNRALIAQEMIWERANCPFDGEHHNERDYEEEETECRRRF